MFDLNQPELSVSLHLTISSLMLDFRVLVARIPLQPQTNGPVCRVRSLLSRAFSELVQHLFSRPKYIRFDNLCILVMFFTWWNIYFRKTNVVLFTTKISVYSIRFLRISKLLLFTWKCLWTNLPAYSSNN